MARIYDQPGVRDADDVADIAQAELQQLVRHDTSCIAEAEERMICKHCAQAHGSPMQDPFMAHVAETCMAMNNLDAFPDEDLSQEGKG